VGGMGGRVRRAGRLLLASLYPPRCLACQDYMPYDAAVARESADPSLPSAEVCWWLCPSCAASSIGLAGACPRCALPADGFIDAPEVHGPCEACRHAPPAWARAVCAFEHDGAPRRAVVRAKSRRGAAVASGLGALLAGRVVDSLGAPAAWDTWAPGPEAWCVVPVPLHTDRLLERGFNQAGRVASEVARRLGLPLASDGLVRLTAGTDQHLQSRADRLAGLAGVYAGQPAVAGHRVALVDDVWTTGATMAACAAAIAEAGGRVALAVAVTRTR